MECWADGHAMLCQDDAIMAEMEHQEHKAEPFLLDLLGKDVLIISGFLDFK